MALADMPAMTPAAWLQFLEPRLDEQAEATDTYHDYFNGEHRLAFATPTVISLGGSGTWDARAVSSRPLRPGERPHLGGDRDGASGRIERSTVLLSRSMRPSSRKRARPSQRVSV